MALVFKYAGPHLTAVGKTLSDVEGSVPDNPDIPTRIAQVFSDDPETERLVFLLARKYLETAGETDADLTVHFDLIEESDIQDPTSTEVEGNDNESTDEKQQSSQADQ